MDGTNVVVGYFMKDDLVMMIYDIIGYYDEFDDDSFNNMYLYQKKNE